MNQPILISITGMDRPGITATITQVLADINVNVLDIGQSVIHDALSLGMMIQVPDESDIGTVKEAVQKKIDEIIGSPVEGWIDKVSSQLKESAD